MSFESKAYESLSSMALKKLLAEGGLTGTAEKALHAELKKRGIVPTWDCPTVTCNTKNIPYDKDKCPTCGKPRPAPDAYTAPEVDESKIAAAVAMRSSSAKPVRIVSIDLPFADLVMLTVKISLAAIPAAIILAIIYFAIGALFWGVWRMH